MKLTGEAEGLALVLDTAPLKARRWSRLKVSPARCAVGGLLGTFVWPLALATNTLHKSYSPPLPPSPAPEPTHAPGPAAAPGSEGALHVSSSRVPRRVLPLAHVSAGDAPSNIDKQESSRPLTLSGHTAARCPARHSALRTAVLTTVSVFGTRTTVSLSLWV
jgi:hypothetical protein